MKENFDDQWNPNEWQGRSRFQVERNNTVMGYSIVVGLACVIIVLISLLFSCRTTENVDCDAYSKIEIKK